MNPLPMDDLDLRIASNGFGRRLLFNVTIRGVLLRATIVLCIIASVLLFFCDLEYVTMVLPVFGGTALLQLMSAFRLRVVLGLVDLVLLFGQLGIAIYWIACWFYFFSNGVAHPILAAVAVYSMTVLLFLQCIWRIGAIISTRGRNLWVPFDIQLGTPLSQRRKTLYILAGAFIWRRLFRRESNIIRIFRGCFSTILLAVFIIFAYTNVLSYPLSELHSGVRVKTFRTAALGDIVDQIDTPTWNIFVVMQWDPLNSTIRQVDTNSAEFSEAVQVLSLPNRWDHRMLKCENVVENQNSALPATFESYNRWIFKIVCPVSDSGSFLYQPDSTPDLLLTVNFTSLGILSNNAMGDPISSTLGREIYSTVSVIAGLSNSTADVLANAQAAALLPNEHLLGRVDVHVRQRFAEAGTAILGLSSLNKLRTFFVGDIVGLRPNPSLAIPRDNNTGSLYLYKPIHGPEDWTIVTDYREDSVLSGLSQVGGFWTFINGLFVFIFGRRLVMIFFGVKPLSTFGLVHSFGRVDLSDSYPRILSEGDLPESQRGLIAFMRDHMVDIDSVKRIDDVESRGEPDIEMAERMLPGERASSTDSLSSAKLISPHRDGIEGSA